jgi:hypothetical protein
MPTRYEQLRQAIANLAASAEEQAAYLDRLFVPVTGGGSAEAFGNDELAEELEDIYPATRHMLQYGEIKQTEIDAIRPLDDLLERWSGQAHADFWKREALFADPRWQDIRDCARKALAQLPDETRANGGRG